MKNKFNIKEELNRIKNLFSHERGVVISEQKILLKEDGSQNINDYPVCVRTFGSPRETKQYSMTYRIFGTGNWDRYVFSSGGLNPEVIKPDGIRDNYYCNRFGQIIIGKNYGEDFEKREAQDQAQQDAAKTSDAQTKAAKAKALADANKQKTPKKTTSEPKSKTTTPKKTKVKYVKPKELEDIRAFQDWLDDHHSDEQEGVGKGWATGFPGGKLEGGSGYGTYGPRTNKAWEVYGNAYGQEKNLLPLPKQEVEIKKIQVEPVKPPTELKIPTNLPTLQPKQNVQVNKDEEVAFGDEEEGSFGD